MALSADLPVPAAATPPDIGVASLYQDIILSHYRAPRHKRLLDAPTASAEQRNPLCGDVVSVQLHCLDDRIVDAGFQARACSISQATASLLLDRLIGASSADAYGLLARIHRVIESTDPLAEVDRVALGDLCALSSVSRFPSRRACVRIVTGAIAEALAGS
jgi:nitrogen fixation protein NifU and related proteins